MRTALLATLAALTACNTTVGDNCDDNDTCRTTEQKYAVEDHPLHSSLAKDFVSDGKTYTLVRFEFGNTMLCEGWDGEDCHYSLYCGFVVDGVDYPTEIDFITPEDALFDIAQYCGADDIEDCDLPGYDLAITDDDDFIDWAYDTDPDIDPLADCVEDL
jgi:hypothetical protein